MVTAEEGASVLATPTQDNNGNTVTAVGRYAYAVYDEGGLLDMNVAGYPTGTTVTQSGRKGSMAFADLTALGQYGLPNSSSPYQVDRIVGWRNYATTQPSNNFPTSTPQSQAFAGNFQTSSTPATNYYNFVINNPNGFVTARSTPSPAPYPWNGRTDQMFISRQQLIAFRTATQFASNALQYMGTFTREVNSPSFRREHPRPASTTRRSPAQATLLIRTFCCVG